MHRGTANSSSQPRPVLVAGVNGPDATNAAHHDLQVTRPWLDALPARVHDHPTARVVDQLSPVIQHRVIDELLQPAAAR